jgi:mannose-6-phosphate isomerase-like protein (cupin superfamily)
MTKPNTADINPAGLRYRLTDGVPLVDPRYGTVWPIPRPAGAPAGLDVATVIVRAGAASPAHYHRRTSEVYLIHAGCGQMRLGDAVVQVQPGDAVVIPATVPHDVRAHTEMILWCISSPPYDPNDDFEIDPIPTPDPTEAQP